MMNAECGMRNANPIGSRLVHHSLFIIF